MVVVVVTLVWTSATDVNSVVLNVVVSKIVLAPRRESIFFHAQKPPLHNIVDKFWLVLGNVLISGGVL